MDNTNGPASAYQISPAGEVVFSTDPLRTDSRWSINFLKTPTDKNGIYIKIYAGEILKNSYLGSFVIDLGSMKMKTERIPLLYRPDPDHQLGVSTGAHIEGVSTGAHIEGSFVIFGQLFAHDIEAMQLKKEGGGGVCFESIIQFDPDSVKTKLIKTGQKVEINGHTLTGPITILENAIIIEASIFVGLSTTQEAKHRRALRKQAAKWYSDEYENIKNDYRKEASAINRLHNANFESLHQKFSKAFAKISDQYRATCEAADQQTASGSKPGLRVKVG